jgi:hypothetical protein
LEEHLSRLNREFKLLICPSNLTDVNSSSAIWVYHHELLLEHWVHHHLASSHHLLTSLVHCHVCHICCTIHHASHHVTHHVAHLVSHIRLLSIHCWSELIH